MVDLIIKEDGEAILNRDVLKGEIITYQNPYLRDINKVETVKVLMDLSKDVKLRAGHYAEGREVIIANENTDDYLIVKMI